MPDVTMPRLSDSMEEGTILAWLKQDGDQVARGEPLVEIETDKANMTYEADQDGILEIVAREGDTLPIGEVIARFRARGNGGGEAGDPRDREQPQDREQPPKPEQPQEPEQPPDRDPRRGGARIKASPVARRLARERGLGLEGLHGSGPGGRIVKADVESAAADPARGAAAPPRDAPDRPRGAPDPARGAPDPARGTPDLETAKGEVTVQQPTRSQQVIARRMAESKATIPHFTLEAEIDMQECLSLRGRLREVAGESPLPTYNDMIVKACALALREFPRANAAYRDGRFELYSRVNVGLAVATEDSLVVPTIFDADSSALGEIAREARALAERVRSGEITPPELSGGTFTVSNLGMFGVSSFSAVINPPQAAILAVGEITERAVVRDRELRARATMRATLACDHRILYGADAAGFLARVRALLEQPVALAL